MSKQSLGYVLKLGAVAAAFHFGGPWAAAAVSAEHTQRAPLATPSHLSIVYLDVTTVFPS